MSINLKMYTPQQSIQNQYSSGQKIAMSNQRYAQPVYGVRTAPGLRQPIRPNVPMPQQQRQITQAYPPNYNPNIIYNRMPPQQNIQQRPLKPTVVYQPQYQPQYLPQQRFR